MTRCDPQPASTISQKSDMRTDLDSTVDCRHSYSACHKCSWKGSGVLSRLHRHPFANKRCKLLQHDVFDKAIEKL